VLDQESLSNLNENNMTMKTTTSMLVMMMAARQDTAQITRPIHCRRVLWTTMAAVAAVMNMVD
jgi:hypothetical protein